MEINETNIKTLCDNCEFKNDNDCNCSECSVTLRLCESCNGVATRIEYGTIGYVMICDDCNPSPESLPINETHTTR